MTDVVDETYKAHMLGDVAPGCTASNLSPGGGTEHRIIAVIPAHNDQSAIGSVVLHALDHVDQVIVVDDCSRDLTTKVARLAGATVISTPHEVGKTRALLAGLKEAEGSGCWAAVILSGDRLHPDDYVQKAIAPITSDEADLVIGSWSISDWRDVPRGRGDLDRSGPSPSSSTDHMAEAVGPRSRLLALSSRALKDLDFSSRGTILESGLIAYSIKNGLTIKEVPIPTPDDIPDGHQANELMTDGPLDKVMPAIGYKRPLLVVGLPGGACAFAGAISVLLAVQGKFLFGSPIAQFLSGAAMFLVGSYFLFSGLALNSISMLRKADHW